MDFFSYRVLREKERYFGRGVIAMFHRYAHWKKRKRPGATLIEMLIALIILAVMLFSIMAVITLTAQSTIAAKEGSVVYLTSLSELEKREAVQITANDSGTSNASLGLYRLNHNIARSPLNSADITIQATWDGVIQSNISLQRQVSPSAWQNAGQEP